MYRLYHIVRYVLIGLTLVFLLNGCAIYDRIFGKTEDKIPEELMSEGMDRFEKGNYSGAIEDFQAIRDRYPYNKLAITAELKIADSLYNRSEYEAAYDAYDEFEKLHPKDNYIPYVIYQKGMCHFRQVKSIDRDQTPTIKAREEFERLIKRFPRDVYSNSARKNLRECLISLAKYELYVGRYYFKMGEYKAAMNRFRYIIENYPDMGQYHEALEYIGRCKERLAEASSSP